MRKRGGKRLLDVPGYRFQALVTSLPKVTHPPLAVWRYYNGRADCENVIKELQAGFARRPCAGKFLGQRGGVEPSQPDLQPDRAVRTPSGLAAKS